MIQKTAPLTWAAGSAVSSAVWLGGDGPMGIEIPAGFQGDSLVVQVALSANGGPGTFVDLYGGGSKMQTSIAAGTRAALVPTSLRGQGWVRFRAETNGAPQAQSAQRDATLIWTADY